MCTGTHYIVKILDFRPWESVKKMICCLERMNFEHLYYQKKLCFVHNMLRLDNSIIVSVMKLFVKTLRSLLNYVNLLMSHHMIIFIILEASYI